jgi:integrase
MSFFFKTEEEATVAKVKSEKVAKGINYVPKTKTYIVQVSQRHPMTRQSRNLRRIRDYDGHPITSLAQAEAMLSHMRRELRERIKNNPFPYWKDIVKEFAENMRISGYIFETVKNYETSLAKHTYERWKFKKINEITSSMILDLFQDNQENWSDHHKKAMRKHVRAVLEYAVEKDLISRNPMPKIKCRAARKLTTVLTESEIQLLLQKCSERDFELKEHIFMSVRLGCRPGELRFLKWPSIDFENKLIYVKGSTTRSGVEKSTKTGDDRVLPMTKTMETFLRRLKLRTHKQEYVLPFAKAWVKHEQSREFKKFLKEIGLPVVRYYDLRASWCTLLLAKGIPPAKVMALGGWKKLATMDHYLRLAGVYIKDGLDCLDHLDLDKKEAEIIEMRNIPRDTVVNDNVVQ